MYGAILLNGVWDFESWRSISKSATWVHVDVDVYVGTYMISNAEFTGEDFTFMIIGMSDLVPLIQFFLCPHVCWVTEVPDIVRSCIHPNKP